MSPEQRDSERKPLAQEDSSGVVAGVLSFNSWGTLQNALAALAKQEVPPDRLIVVDNASIDETGRRLRNMGWLEVAVLPFNEGVGAGHNRIASTALEDPSCRLVWLLEHDTIPARDCLSQLLVAYEQLRGSDPRIGALVPRVARNEGEAMRDDATEQAPHPHRRFTFNGALIPRSTIESLGSFRTDFFVGLEDTEFTERMRAAGMRIYRVPRALVIHRTKGDRRLGVRPTVQRGYYSTRNSVFMDVWLRRRFATVFEYILRALAGAMRTLLFEDRKLRRIAARLTGTFDGLSHRMGPRNYWFFHQSGRRNRTAPFK